MKKKPFILLITWILLLTSSLMAQDMATPLVSKLTDGCPKEIAFIQKQLNLSEMSQANLATGIDTLGVMFGEFNQQGQKGYWIASSNKGTMATFSTASLVKIEGSFFASNTIDIKLDNSSGKITVHITHDTSKNEIQYGWVNNNQSSNVAVIQKVELPLQKGNMFPSIKVLSLEGDSISIKNFADKYVVINWWATTCGPCRAEIPGFNTLVEKYKNNPKVVFLAIADNKKGDLESFLSQHPFHYIQALGDKKAAGLFGASSPKNIIVNPQGMITYYSEGGNEEKYLIIDKELQRLDIK